MLDVSQLVRARVSVPTIIDFASAVGSPLVTDSSTGRLYTTITGDVVGEVPAAGIVSVKDPQFGAKGDGVTDDTAALTAVRAYVAGLSDPVMVYWPAGKYVYSASPNWAISNSAHQALGKVELSYTGSSNALIFDGGSIGSGVENVKFLGNFVVEGTASATNGIFARALHRSRIEATVLGAGTTSAGLLTNWCVLTDFYVKVSVNEGAFISIPANGYVLDQRGGGESTASCNFFNPIVEGVSGTGIKLVVAAGNNFFGGTSESNNRGIEIAGGNSSLSNKFFGIDLEGNAVEAMLLTGVFDNTFYGMKVAGLIHLTSVCADCRFIGGYLDGVTVDAGCNNTSFIGLTMGSNGGAFTDNGNFTCTFDVRDATAGVFRAKTPTGFEVGGPTGGHVANAINTQGGYYLNNVLLLGAKDTSISTGVGVIHMKSANPATNAAWIPITSADGTVYFVPGWTTNNP